MSARRNYHHAAATRVRELGMRLGFALLIALAAGYAASSVLSALWFLAVLVAQLANAAAGLQAVRDPAFAPSRLWEVRYLALTFVNSAVFSAITPLMWFTGGGEGRLISLVVLMGGLLNVGTQPETSGRLLWAGSLPYMLALVALPTTTVLLEPRASAVQTAFLITGLALYLLHILRAVRQRDAAARASADARQAAELASAAKSEFLTTLTPTLQFVE
jgi:hypothetical protein